jgi:hypothetical protein
MVVTSVDVPKGVCRTKPRRAQAPDRAGQEAAEQREADRAEDQRRAYRRA